MSIVETQSQQPSVNVYPNANGGSMGYGGGGFGDMFGMGGGGVFFWLILFFFMMMFMGNWGNNGNNGGGNGGGTVYVPYGAPYMIGSMNGGCCGNDASSITQAIRNGFDQSAVIGGINGLENQIQTGFSNAEVSRCNQQANLLATMNSNQNAITNAFNQQSMALQNCCCENRAATADLKYTVATEACADRAAVGDAFQALTAQNAQNMNVMMTQFNNGIQSLKDEFCDLKMSQKDAMIADLQRQLTRSEIAGMIDTSRQSILANNDLQTAALEQYLAPTPRPAYIVQNPNCCAQNYNNCTGCCRN